MLFHKNPVAFRTNAIQLKTTLLKLGQKRTEMVGNRRKLKKGEKRTETKQNKQKETKANINRQQ